VLRGGVEATLETLSSATARRDGSALQVALAQAEKFNMSAHPDEAVRIWKMRTLCDSISLQDVTFCNISILVFLV